MKIRWIVLGVALLIVTAVAGVALAYPSVAATTCPGCYGLAGIPFPAMR